MSGVPKTMKALVCYGIGNYKFVEEFPVPECGPDEILIKTEACGICAGDVKAMHGAERIWGDGKSPSFAKPPFIPGHEFLGKVVEVGANRTDFAIGDRVTADQIVPCGKCKFCKTGRYWMCEIHNTFGFQHTNNGGMAEYVRYPQTAVVHKVPFELATEKALLIEPYACSKHAVDRAGITNEDVVVISGAGTLGLGMVTYARLKNPYQLIVLDLVEDRLKLAKRFGADIVLNPSQEDVVQRVKELTDGYGCDIYIEATGHPSSVIQGLEMIRKLGTFVEFSVFGSPVTVDWSIIGDAKELNLLGSHLSPYCYPFVIEKINSGVLKTEDVVTQYYGLDDWETAFDHASGKYGDLKVAFKFD